MKRIIRTRWAGNVYILVSIVLGVVAVNSSNNLLYLTTATLLGYMLASGLAGRRNIRNASVSFAFPDEIYAQIPCAVSVRVANKSRFVPIFLVDVSLAAEHAFFSIVQPGKTESRTLFVAFPFRGRQAAPEAELSSVYPFNFFVRYWPFDPEKSGLGRAVTVFPYPLRCETEFVFVRKGLEEEGEAADPLVETDIMGVRPYAEGDSMKRIHWKSSARTGKLKTRLYDGTSSGRSRIVDLERLLEGDVERGLSMATFVIVESMKSGLPIGMRTRKELILPATGYVHKKDLLSKLALYRGSV